ncbi:dihydropteroate synthase [Methylosinus sporium]|uniref:Dihydropteroate synthase n=2 Tax=Methylosinus sporium TaxID=428 RepID=A0A2U1SM92_METSR|nr:dihydropteroate synthase [Methylosinus sporium]
MTTTIESSREQLFSLVAARPVIMGIVNVTPDSFSDGGRFFSPEAALAQAKKLAEDGADIVDVGAESTRPGHTPLTAEEEWARLEPLLRALVSQCGVPVSIDTYKAQTARRALAAGVTIVNDIWGLQRDPDMAPAIAEAGAGVVAMHNRAEVAPQIDIVADMLGFFERSLEIAAAAGVPESRVILDPGVGFGKTREQDFEALRAVPQLMRFGRPVLIGVSRKRLFGALLGAEVDARLIATVAANLIAAMNGARIFRVHDAAEHRAAFAVLDTLTQGKGRL